MVTKHHSTGISDEAREERQERLLYLFRKGVIDVSYHDYINSPYWKERSKKLKRKEGKCCICGSTKKLNIHHKHYRTLGEEKEEDLMVCCDGCHKDIHKKMAEEKRSKGINLREKRELPEGIVSQIHKKILEEERIKEN